MIRCSARRGPTRAWREASVEGRTVPDGLGESRLLIGVRIRSATSVSVDAVPARHPGRGRAAVSPDGDASHDVVLDGAVEARPGRLVEADRSGVAMLTS